MVTGARTFVIGATKADAFATRQASAIAPAAMICLKAMFVCLPAFLSCWCVGVCRCVQGRGGIGGFGSQHVQYVKSTFCMLARPRPSRPHAMVYDFTN